MPWVLTSFSNTGKKRCSLWVWVTRGARQLIYIACSSLLVVDVGFERKMVINSLCPFVDAWLIRLWWDTKSIAVRWAKSAVKILRHTHATLIPLLYYCAMAEVTRKFTCSNDLSRLLVWKRGTRSRRQISQLHVNEDKVRPPIGRENQIMTFLRICFACERIGFLHHVLQWNDKWSFPLLIYSCVIAEKCINYTCSFLQLDYKK